MTRHASGIHDLRALRLVADAAALDDASYADAASEADREAYDADVAQSTRDDGMLYHGRLPGDDVDAFNPCVAVAARPPSGEYPAATVGREVWS